jgi:hypothetical protein
MSGLQAVRVIGGIVPPSMLARVQAGDVAAESLTPASFRLAGNETLRDAAARAWSYLQGAWAAFREIEEPTISQTRERWLLPLVRELGYGNVPSLSHGLTIEEVHYPISHGRDHIPIHLLAPSIYLDRRNPGVAGAARAPQAMLQEFLNRSDGHLWALLSNGTRLRMLRDSTALAGSAYLEFDLEAIFGGELYSEFLLMFLLAHSTRTEKRGGEESSPADCWLEKWRNDAVETGTRALDKLRIGVEKALTDLGDGFLHHPNNGWLVDALRSGQLTDRDYLRALLRLVYRLLFCFVAEDRNALLDPQSPPEAKQRYTTYFSTARLRRISRIRAGGPHPDLWDAQRLVLKSLGGKGLPQLGVPALGGLFDPDPRSVAVDGQPGPDLLLSADLGNHALLSAVRALAWFHVAGGRTQPVDYRNLGAEELGSVYESLLELIPRVNLSDMVFRLETVAGHDRKTTGSYYTPPAMVSALLDTALDPLLNEAVKNANDAKHAEERLLALTVCDPASGSGGFLVAAARRIARRLAQVRSGEDEPTPEQVQHALRDVIGHCIYGVDINDLAAELAKVSLWLEALEPGKPLGFLDARIRVGNSLIGATPALLAEGIPDAAFKEISGDDKKYAAALRKQNKIERSGQSSLFAAEGTIDTTQLAGAREDILSSTDDIDAMRDKADAWQDYEHSDTVRRARLRADAWTAAFVWSLSPDSPPPVTHEVLQQIAAHPDDPTLAQTVGEVDRLADEYRFFHWNLEFPEVFGDSNSPNAGPDGWPGGFSCLLGNPPWERVKLQEQEFFAARSPQIAQAPNAAARRKLTKALIEADPPLHQAFLDEKRRSEGVSHLLRMSGRYPLNGRGDVNTYAVFAELFRSLTAPHGRSGVVVPTGIATDATTQHFFKDLVTSASLAALYDFENAAPIFDGVHRSFKFCLLTMAGRAEHEPAASFAFFLHDPADIDTARFALSPAEITLLNPNTGTCPIFRTRRDAEITLGIYRRVPVLIDEAKVAAGDPDGNPWGVSFMTMFHMSNDSHLFRTRDQLEADGWVLKGNVFVRGTERMLPLYQGIMCGPYDHRVADVVHSPTALKRQNQPLYLSDADKVDPLRSAQPAYWVASWVVTASMQSTEEKSTMLTVRDITSSTNERTVVPGLIPPAAVGNTVPLILPATSIGLLSACLASFAFDFTARLKVGGTHLNFFILEQLPAVPPKTLEVECPWNDATMLSTWMEKRVLELTYTAWDMAPFAEDLGDCCGGRVYPPFVWDDERRSWLRAELDAAFFHLYGIIREEVDYILDTFPIVRRKDEAAYGEYRTKNRILQVYDALANATETGKQYKSVLDPAPGHGPRHPPRQEKSR